MASKRVRQKRNSSSSTDEKRSSSSSWSDLPEDLMELILRRLYFADQIHSRAVCKSWNTIDRFPPLKQMPWLLVFDDNAKRNSCKLVDPQYKKTYTVNMKSIKEKKKIKSFDTMDVHESKNGWLLISSQYNHKPNTTTSLFLYSPFVNENNNFIELPILNFGSISFATFISNPLKQDCLILTLNISSTDDRILVINICRRGDNSWNTRNFKCRFSLSSVKSWMCSDEGVFHYTTSNGKVGAFDFAREDWIVFPNSQEISSQIENEGRKRIRMVKWNEELLLISEDTGFFYAKHVNGCPYVSNVLRLDLSSMTWERMQNMGGRELFLGTGYSSVLNFSEERNETSNGRIYYTSGFTDIRKQSYPCSRLYGSIATKDCRKLWIDPPPHPH